MVCMEGTRLLRVEWLTGFESHALLNWFMRLADSALALRSACDQFTLEVNFIGEVLLVSLLALGRCHELMELGCVEMRVHIQI